MPINYVLFENNLTSDPNQGLFFVGAGGDVRVQVVGRDSGQVNRNKPGDLH